MIDVKELRIGNLTTYEGSSKRITIADFVGLCFSEVVVLYNPIPLTPSIAEKCDLSSIKTIHLEDDIWVEIEFRSVIGQETNARHEVWVYYNNALLVRCSHLHQLQNLYFALTGQELNTHSLTTPTVEGAK